MYLLTEKNHTKLFRESLFETIQDYSNYSPMLNWRTIARREFDGNFYHTVFTMRVVIYDILSMAIIPTLSTSILFCDLW